MILPIIAGLLASAVAVWVFAPLAGSRGTVADESDMRLEAFHESLQAVYRSILDLELDHEMTKVSDTDYSVLRGQQENEAISLLRQIDAATTLHDASEIIEREITAARKRLSGS